METFSHRESVLLGYMPQRSSTSDPISSSQSPDIDFHDVFGGPPRRASTREIRYSFGGENTDVFGSRSDEEIRTRRHRWSGLSEKPVFGEENINKRRYPNDNFFDDIFKGGDSSCSSPRKNDRDPFSSSPGSRAFSPARPLPPRVSEPFSSSSLPAQFSLPAKLIKGTDLPAFGSGASNHHKTKDGSSNIISFYFHLPLSRSSNQLQKESTNDVSFKTSLLRGLSRSDADLKSLDKSDEIYKSGNLNSSEATTVSQPFHFSIYKWASKGVPLTLPFKGGYSSRRKEKFKFERNLSASRRIACEGMAKESPAGTSWGIESRLVSDSVPSDGKSSEIEHDKEVQKQPFEESVVCKSEPEIPSTHQEIVKDSPEEEKERIYVTTKEAPKTEITTLHSLLSATNGIPIKKELEQNKAKSTKKSSEIFEKKISKRDGDVQVMTTNLQASPVKNRSRGKVKEFVKIFNQETSDQPNLKDTFQSPSSRWKERGKSKTQDDQNVTTTKVNEKVQLPNANKTRTQDAPMPVDESQKQDERHHSRARTDDYNATSTFSGLKDNSASTAALVPDGLEAMEEHPGDSFREKILIKELRQDEEQAGDSQESIWDIDAKIKKWSNGKEGNIRSLLSNLQYVLWPESGWKPVPLVDIIEGNAVKRSYQRALLALHPDKLQQKGATSHQKYIAEKVFDILQEAWTHFSTLGLM